MRKPALLVILVVAVLGTVTALWIGRESSGVQFVRSKWQEVWNPLKTAHRKHLSVAVTRLENDAGRRIDDQCIGWI